MARKFKWKLFGKHLRDMRLSADIGLREIARQERIDRSAWSRAERGLPVSVPNFLRLCEWMDSNPFQYHPGCTP